MPKEFYRKQFIILTIERNTSKGNKIHSSALWLLELNSALSMDDFQHSTKSKWGQGSCQTWERSWTCEREWVSVHAILPYCKTSIMDWSSRFPSLSGRMTYFLPILCGWCSNNFSYKWITPPRPSPFPFGKSQRMTLEGFLLPGSWKIDSTCYWPRKFRLNK